MKIETGAYCDECEMLSKPVIEFTDPDFDMLVFVCLECIGKAAAMIKDHKVKDEL